MAFKLLMLQRYYQNQDSFVDDQKYVFDLLYTGYADPFKVCCGYHENYDHVWCGNKATINNTEVYGASCKDPSKSISWDGVHYTQAVNQWVANHTHYGSLTDPPIPITQACHRR